MVRLQQNIENLKIESGDNTEEEKVAYINLSSHVQFTHVCQYVKSLSLALTSVMFSLSLSKERSLLFDKQHSMDREKLQKIRLLMVKAVDDSYDILICTYKVGNS